MAGRLLGVLLAAFATAPAVEAQAQTSRGELDLPTVAGPPFASEQERRAPCQTMTAPCAVAQRGQRGRDTQFTPDERALVERLVGAEMTPPFAASSLPLRAIAFEFVGSAPGGPPWWKVSKGEATVWVLGLPPGRTLATQRWNKTPLRRTLDGARLLIAPYSPWSRVALDKSPFNELPNLLGAKVTAAAVQIRQPLRNRLPTFSDAVRTHGAFYDRARLTDHGSSEVIRQAFEQEVRVATPPKRPGPDLGSLYAGGADVAACVDAMVEDMATPPQASKAASEAWAAGDVAGALTAPPDVSWACEVLWSGYRDRTVGFHTEAIAMALEMPSKVVAAADIDHLVAQDGILPRLRAMGLEVSGPLQPTAR